MLSSPAPQRFDSALIVKGLEGGVIPSLQKPARLFYYRGHIELESVEVDLARFGTPPNRAGHATASRRANGVGARGHRSDIPCTRCGRARNGDAGR